jgi:SdpI/YfhL protein family
VLPEIVFAGVGVLIILLAIPLILRRVPRNDWYGLRTEKTMHGPEQVWYDANRDAGLGLCAVGILTLAAALCGVLLFHRALLAAAITAAVLLVSSTAELFRVLRRHGKH